VFKRGKELDKFFVVFDILGQLKDAIRGKNGKTMDEIDFESLHEVGLLEIVVFN
jgi:hypothetical protein